MASYTQADQARDARRKLELAEQMRGTGYADLADEILAAAQASPHSQLGRAFSAEPSVDFAKRRVPNFEREEAQMLNHLDDTVCGKDSYISDACKLLPDAPESDL